MPFRRCEAELWNGFYRKPNNRESVFRVGINDDMRILAQEADFNLTCPVVETPAVRQMARAVNDLKEQHTRHRGGSFVINEYGYVIVPENATFQHYLVGYLDDYDALEFTNPMNGQSFSLNAEMDLDERWIGPYLGMRYNLRGGDDRIYYNDDGDEQVLLDPALNDPALVRNLRHVKRTGPASFIVNLHGIVLTKQEQPDHTWAPKYVGRIDLDSWFTEEDIQQL